ncbi:MAG: Uncharacterised protein [Owenweeksia sp. TMED14]|nr:MAG: Uncharacterised protein [Owenweeksia sp. TMED14]
MPKLNSFAAFRPQKDLNSLVSTRTYKSYSEIELQEKRDSNPFSFLHVIKSQEINKKNRFKSIRKEFQTFIDNEYLIQDEKDHLYVYEQKSQQGSFSGVIGIASIDDYNDGKIIKHEDTITERELLFSDYLNNVGFHAEPVLLARNSNLTWDTAIEEIMKLSPVAEFTTADGVSHKIWIPSNRSTEIIMTASESMDKFYVADGHHRLASSALAKKSDGILAFVINKEQLQLSPFYRFVKGECLNNTDWSLSLKAHLLKTKPEGLPREGIHALDGKGWWHISEKSISFPQSKWLSENILGPLWNITDERNDKRIRYLAGTNSPEAIEVSRKPDEVAFVSSAPLWEQIETASDIGIMLPPKSTYIEPKIRSGMILFSWK